MFKRKEYELSADEVRAPWRESAPETVPGEETVKQTVAERTAGRSPFLVVEEVAVPRGRRGSRSIPNVRVGHSRSSTTASYPHFRRSGSRRLLFRADWLDSFDSGAPLEVVELPDNGRIVRPEE